MAAAEGVSVQRRRGSVITERAPDRRGFAENAADCGESGNHFNADDKNRSGTAAPSANRLRPSILAVNEQIRTYAIPTDTLLVKNAVVGGG